MQFAGKSVAVTGIGCLAATGSSLGASLEDMARGARRCGPPRRVATTLEQPSPVFEVEDELAGGMGAELLRTARLLLAAADQALADAGLADEDLRTLRVGVCVGTSVGAVLTTDSLFHSFRHGRPIEWDEVERFLRSNPATALRDRYGLRGPSQTVVNACSSGTDALGIALGWIRAGDCDVALAGGTDEISPFPYHGFHSLLAVDRAACRPFDRRRQGLNLGEGAAVFVLEPMDGPRRARAFVHGYGSSNDGFHLTAPDGEGAGLERAIDMALADACCTVGDIAFVNAHGTGTLDNDRAESQVLSRRLGGIPFLSTKGYTGHTLGAAGAIEAAFSVGFLERGEVPASGGFEEPDPDLRVAPVASLTRVAGRTALSQSLAFGGHNAVVVLGLDPRADRQRGEA